MKYLIVAMFALLTGLAKAEVTVLLYHHIANGDPSDTLTTPARLNEHLDALKAAGYHTVKMNTVARYMRGEIHLPEKTVALAFDDGWRDNLNAVAILNTHEMNGTFYIITSAFQDPQYLNEADVAAISANSRFEIGAHTHTHFMKFVQDLTKLDLLTMSGEAALSKNMLEHITHKPVQSLAWPFGYHTPESIEMAAKIGFTSTVIVSQKSANTPGKSPLEIDRLTVTGSCTGQDVVRMVETKSIVCH